jgi:hypothetical protein
MVAEILAGEGVEDSSESGEVKRAANLTNRNTNKNQFDYDEQTTERKKERKEKRRERGRRWWWRKRSTRAAR